MKSIVMLYIFFIILSFSNTVFSHSNHKIRLYDIIRKTINKDTDTLLLEVRPHKYVHSATISPVNEQSQSNENEEEIELKPRDSWDSGEDQYFRWASLNRRPMESLAGRKRSM